MFRFSKNQTYDTNDIPSSIQILSKKNPFVKTEKERADMTISCKDCDFIPKVKNAGLLSVRKGVEVQIMHNGMLVKSGGYYGSWMQRIIKELKGHHEPQEEKVFYMILKEIKSDATMIELGSFWSYYSLWFHKEIPNATNICCEPDPNNMKVGKINASINNANLTFINSAAGSSKNTFINFPLESEPGKLLKVPIIPVDELYVNQKLKNIDVLHMDVQGAELSAIKGAERVINKRKLRFLIVSTHHYSISGDPLTHFKCIDLIKSLGGHIITQHSVLESFSGDGLIVASFEERDKNLKIEVSINSSSNSLYEPYEVDLANLMIEYDMLRDKV